MGNKVYIGLGSNLGDRQARLQEAREKIAGMPGTVIRKLSSLYLTEPWGYHEQGEFINQVVEIETILSPEELLACLQEIEIKMGRQHVGKWGPRIIDLDILLYGDQVINLPELKVPHPYMRQRLFVLIPLQEMDPKIVFPEDGMTIKEVLNSVLGREKQYGIKKI